MNIKESMEAERKIDAAALYKSSIELKKLLESYSTIEPEAALCLRELTPILQMAASGEITTPRSTAAPCGYYFHEGGLRKHASLEAAYSNFSMALQGWDDASLRILLNMK